MARGGYGRGLGIPLKDRIRIGPDGKPVEAVHEYAAGTEHPTRSEDCPGRHCWITDPVDGSSTRPALLLEWRKDPAGDWFGFTVYPAQLRPGRWASICEWVPASRLEVRPLA
jgi:hypothetical protein